MKSNIQLKHSNYVAFSHFHGCAVNNLGSHINDCGNLNTNGLSEVGIKGLRDYGTGIHEAAHAYDLEMSVFNTHSYADMIVEQARKNLGLRINSRKYMELRIKMTGSLTDIDKNYELFAYAIETVKAGPDNELANEIYRLAVENK